MRIRAILVRGAALLAMLVPGSAMAGPPFLTDDPEPTEHRHWEIYSPLLETEGKGADYAGAIGVEINYGALPDVQVTLGLPLAYAHDTGGTRWGAGDVEMSVKYRFYHDERAGVSVAFFPGITLPTAGNGMGAGKVTALLPVWAQKDFGDWSVFGGGGYAFNPGSGNRNYWTGGLAITRRVDSKLLIGLEAERQGADRDYGSGSTSLGIGIIYTLRGPIRLLASGGPTFDDAGGRPGFHGFLALGFDY